MLVSPLRHVRGLARLALPLALVALAALLPAAAGADVRVGTAPAIPPAAEPAGNVSPQRQLHLVVGLEPNDPAALAAFAESVSTPGSANFRQYLGSAEFASRFAPTEAQIAKVRASLEAQGLEVGTPPADHLVLPVSGTAEAVEAAFATPLEKVELPSGRLAYANLRAPAVASSAAPYVAGVVGLDDLREFESHAVESKVVTGGPQPCSEAREVEFFGGWPADQIANAYGFSSLYGTGNLGQGQAVALVELEPFAAQDIREFQTCYGTSTPVNTINVGPLSTSEEAGESTLDIEQIISLAPGAAVDVYQGTNSGAGLLAILARITSDNAAKSISTSWGACELPTERTFYGLEGNLLEEAAAQGQSFFAASGDDGSEDCLKRTHGVGLAVDDPASQPFATGVGGTTLTNAPKHLETLWNEGTHGGGGGGVSSIWPMPTYQSSAAPGLGVVNANSGSQCGAALCREVPDVSADAAPSTGYPIYFDGGWEEVGGTSAAAPLWAAFAALADASPACAARPVGFVNPALYSIGSTAYAANLRDVTQPSPQGYATNDTLFAGTLPYPATAGYDMATGLGTPIGGPLANSLCGLAGPAFSVSVTSPGAQQTTVGKPVSLQIAAAQSAGRELTYAAGGLPAGLTINPANGLISGTPTIVGTSYVTVTATDPFGTVGSVPFIWSTVPAVRVVRAKLTGLSSGKPKLTFRVQANPGAALKSVKAKVPAGLTLNRSVRIVRRQVKVEGAKNKRLAATASPVWKGFRVKLKKPAAAATFVIPFPALVADPKLVKEARHHKLKTLKLALTVTETTGNRGLSLPLEPR